MVFSKPECLFQLSQFGSETTEAKPFQFQTIITSPSWKLLGICLGFFNAILILENCWKKWIYPMTCQEDGEQLLDKFELSLCWHEQTWAAADMSSKGRVLLQGTLSVGWPMLKGVNSGQESIFQLNSSSWQGQPTYLCLGFSVFWGYLGVGTKCML